MTKMYSIMVPERSLPRCSLVAQLGSSPPWGSHHFHSIWSRKETSKPLTAVDRSRVLTGDWLEASLPAFPLVQDTAGHLRWVSRKRGVQTEARVFRKLHLRKGSHILFSFVLLVLPIPTHGWLPGSGDWGPPRLPVTETLLQPFLCPITPRVYESLGQIKGGKRKERLLRSNTELCIPPWMRDC